jgi:hypothetical protein
MVRPVSSRRKRTCGNGFELTSVLKNASVNFTTVVCCAAKRCPAEVPPYALKRELGAD